MEDDPTRTETTRSKSARPPAAVFVEPKLASPGGERTEPEPEPDFDPEPEPGPDVEPEPVPAPRRAPVKRARKPEPKPVSPPWWTRTPTHPSAVPAYLAEIAVERYGDSAHRYVDWLRTTYPEATRDGFARHIVERFATRGWYGGPLVTVARQARLVLHLAAVYGRDPRGPERVPELLSILEPKAFAGPVVARLAGRVLPGAGLLAGALADAGALERTARRSRAYYGVRD
jgi:hypothetical protein